MTMKNLWHIAQKINTGRIETRFNEPMAIHTTLKIGGPADIFISISSISELTSVIRLLAKEHIPWFLLGKGANILVGDKGIRGAVIDCTGMQDIRRTDKGIVASCGVSIDTLCEHSLALGLEGMENFYGMPGTLGGSIYMNARCYEKEIVSLLDSILVISPSGNIETHAVTEAEWSYKQSPYQPGKKYGGYCIAGALLNLKPANPVEISSIMRSRKMDRVGKGHYRFPSAGSMFKNDRSFGSPSGFLIDALGLRGFRIGDAGISTEHANIFINLGEASAKDMLALIDYTQKRVLKAYGFALEPEVLTIGDF
jgi:UDP-N-acetylmuramate dehydrogenase